MPNLIMPTFKDDKSFYVSPLNKQWTPTGSVLVPPYFQENNLNSIVLKDFSGQNFN